MTAKSIKKSPMKKALRLLVLLFLLVSLLAISAWIYLERWLHTPLKLPAEGYTYQLNKGRALAHMAQDLGTQGYLTHPRWLTLYARATGATHIHAGEYFLPVGLTPIMLLQKLRTGAVVLYQVTLLEGWTYQRALTELHSKDSLLAVLTTASMTEQLAQLDLPIEHPEGWFFPDTYSYTRGTTDIEILHRAHARMQATLTELWRERAENLPYRDAYEALIMASIIERETGAAWERDQIAGVFVRRLNQGMRLQTDPTVIYGMGDAYQGKISSRDLKTATPYNTYTMMGLPPTPIALPGRAAIYAALHPAPGSTLYFVAKGDGTTYFSENLTEHNQAVRRYQLKRRADYRSTPPKLGKPETSIDAAQAEAQTDSNLLSEPPAEL